MQLSLCVNEVYCLDEWTGLFQKTAAGSLCLSYSGGQQALYVGEPCEIGGGPWGIAEKSELILNPSSETTLMEQSFSPERKPE